MYKFVYIDWENDYDLFFGRCYEKMTHNVFQNVAPDKRKDRLLRFLYKLHNTPKIAKHIHLPFKGIWNRWYLDKAVRKKLDRADCVCFVFTGLQYQLDEVGFFDYLRKQYPHCRLLHVFGDKVALYENRSKTFSMDAMKQRFDVVASYNEEDVKTYGLAQLPPTPHDYSIVEEDESIPSSDLIFVGREKGRLNELISIYEKCTAAGLVCDFHIVGVPEEKQKYQESISYNKKISYMELLTRTKRSRCVLNIIQDGVVGVTLRDYEAIGMNKLLMTNGKAVREVPGFCEDMLIDTDNLDAELYKLTSNAHTSWGSQHPISFSDYFGALGRIVFENP